MKLEFKGFLSFLILHELSKKNLCGDDLAQKIGVRRGSELTPGTIYPALKRLHKEKLLKRKKDGRKKYYSLTDSGKEEYIELLKLFQQYFKGVRKR